MNPTHLLVTLPDPKCASLVQQLLHNQVPRCKVLEKPSDCSQAACCRWLKELPAGQVGEVQALLSDAIAVLEQTRHAFKSAQLAQLRKRLVRMQENLSNNSQ